MVSLTFLNLLLLSSCAMDAPGKPLLGKITIIGGDSCIIYMDSDTPHSSFKLKRDRNEVEYYVTNWLHTKDAFIGGEGLPGANYMDERSNIVVFDLAGKIIDRIYKAEKGEIACAWYTSWDDKYLIFTSERNMNPDNPAFDDGYRVPLKIMDIKQKKVIGRIDSIYEFPNFLIEESPWLHGDGYRFLYSMNVHPNFKDDEKSINPTGAAEGVYVFDVNTGKSNLLIPGGFSAAVSPVANRVVFERDYSIIVKDLNSNKEKTIYKYKSNEVIMSKHWTPDGRYVYLSCLNRSSISDVFNKSAEKLIEVSSGKEQSFKSIRMLYESYTWK